LRGSCQFRLRYASLAAKLTVPEQDWQFFGRIVIFAARLSVSLLFCHFYGSAVSFVAVLSFLRQDCHFCRCSIACLRENSDFWPSRVPEGDARDERSWLRLREHGGDGYASPSIAPQQILEAVPQRADEGSAVRRLAFGPLRFPRLRLTTTAAMARLAAKDP
jgi:hypothetical protein